MQLDARKDLADVLQATDRIIEFTRGRDFSAYRADPLLRSAVGRQFEIVGEAMGQLARVDLDTAERMSDYRRMIGLRNVLIHRYGDVDDRLVGDVAQTRVERLRTAVA